MFFFLLSVVFDEIIVYNDSKASERPKEWSRREISFGKEKKEKDEGEAAKKQNREAGERAGREDDVWERRVYK